MLQLLLSLVLPTASTASAINEAARTNSVHERVLRSVVHHATPTVLDHQQQQQQWALAALVIQQPLDHFEPLQEPTWKMRYWVDKTHWDGGPSSPVFLSMGGEGRQGPPGGAMTQMAEQHKALMFSIEHRYYGESIPTADFTTPNLRWLSAEQALADAAFFVRAMQKEYNLTRDARWISFGGSYSGELAAWVRIKYPDLIYGAVASSAPVSAIVDYDGYDPIVANALAYPLVGGSPACRDAVASAFEVLEDLFDNHRPKLQRIFGTCGPVVSDGDAFLLHDYVSDDFMGLVQYNSDAPLGSGRINIRSRCAEMLNKSFGIPPTPDDGQQQRNRQQYSTPFDRLVAITQERAAKDKCIFDPDPSGVTDSIKFSKHLLGCEYCRLVFCHVSHRCARNTADVNGSNPGRSFPYQMCVDGVGHDQTCKPEKGCIFSPKFASFTLFMQQCTAAFGANRSELAKAVAWKSAEYPLL